MSCLATQLIYSSFVWTNTAILFAAYVIYACVVLFWRSLEDAGYPTIALLIDFGFFFLSAIGSAAYALLDHFRFLRLRSAGGGAAAQLVEDARDRSNRDAAALSGAHAAFGRGAAARR